LEGTHIFLRPLDADADCLELYGASHGSSEKEGKSVFFWGLFLTTFDSAIWIYMWDGPFQDSDQFKKYLLALAANPAIVPFTVVDKPSQRKIGITTYLNIVPSNRTLEIGGIWYCA
jgi:RimJ/RimL family protein N-acetyltransferase